MIRLIGRWVSCVIALAPLATGLALTASACGAGGAAPTKAPQLPPAAPIRETAAAAPTAQVVATRAPTPSPGTSPSPTLPATPSPRPAVSSPTAGVTGNLEGKASIGPLTPVQRVGVPEPTPPPEACTSRGLAVYRDDGKTLVTSFSFQPDCSYRVPLSPGSYVVDLKDKPAIGGSKDLPKKVTIEAGKTTRLDVSIDTGIR